MRNLILTAAVFAILAACTPPQQEAAAPVIDKEEIVVENIMNRRSIRDYKDQQVSKEQLAKLMKSAINAPSANNRQPWQVVVVQDQELLGKIRTFGERNPIYNAPTVIFVAYDTTSRTSQFDCGLLTENILLTAEAMGLGTCVVGSVNMVLNDPGAKDILGGLDLPENYAVVVGICLGYKNESPDAKPREAANVKYID